MGSLAWMAFRALPGLAQLGAVAAVLLGLATTYGVWHHKIASKYYQKGWNAHEMAIVREDKRAVDAALAKRGVRDDCINRGLRWSTVTGECQGR
jgi:hypothetical protein